MKRFLFFNVLLFLLNINTFYGQTDLPNVISPSPEAASITKFVDMKINEYQGMVQQQIPLYQISDGAINLPISLNYQSGGFKVIESSSSIGLGWSLYAGGAVTRSVNGLPDDNSGVTKGFLTVSSEVDYNYLSHGEKTQSRYSYLQSIGQGCYDAQPDIFNFNFNGYSGKFHFDWDRNIIISSESEVTITPIQNNGNLSKIEGWIFKTPNGFTYTFRANETTTNIKSGTNLCYLAQDGFNSSWYLTEISDALGKRNLFFEYDTYTIKDHNIHKSQSRTHQTGGSSQCGGNISGILQYNSTNIDIGGRALRRIYSNTSPVEVLFVAGTNKVMDTSTDFYAIAEIQIKNRIKNTMIKKFKLTHSYETGRLTLKSIQEFGKTTVGLPPYTFFYHGSLPLRTSTKRDHWGYTNTNGRDMLPLYFIHTSGDRVAGFGTANRSANFKGSRNGVLYKIGYPTGGYDEYTYEQNTYGYVGGLQIDEFEVNKANPQVKATGDSAHGCTSVVTDTDVKTFTIPANPAKPGAKIITKIYGSVKKYTEDYFSAGKTPKAKLIDSQGNTIYQVSLIHNNINEYILLSPGQYTLSAEATWRDCDITSRDIATMSVLYDEPTNIRLYEKPVGGVRVASISKYDSNGALLLSQKYDYKNEQGYSSGFIHKEPNYLFDKESLVWVSSGNGGYNVICQSIVALDADRSNLGMTTGGHLGYEKVAISQKDGTNGKTELNFIGASNIVSETFPFPPPIDRSHSNGKIITSKIKDNHGKTQKQLTKGYKIKETFTNALKISFKGGTLFDEGNFVFGRYRILMGHSKTENEETITKLEDKDFITTTAYTYNPSLQKLKEQTSQSTNKVERHVFFYPEDYAQLTGLTLDEISAYQNLVSDHRISEPIQNQLYIKTGTAAEKLKTTKRITYANTIATSNQTLQAAVAMAKNNQALQTEVGFDKYDDKGNILQYKKTGGITTSFIWSYDKMYPVAKVENATFLEISVALGITETALKNFSTGSLNTLNNLRAALPNAMVSTYIYNPLVGKISETDPKGYTIYYEYDAFDRLQFIKDTEGNLVSERKYNYKNQ
jgi:YD repeat-containing protein